MVCMQCFDHLGKDGTGSSEYGQSRLRAENGSDVRRSRLMRLVRPQKERVGFGGQVYRDDFNKAV